MVDFKAFEAAHKENIELLNRFASAVQSIIKHGDAVQEINVALADIRTTYTAMSTSVRECIDGEISRELFNYMPEQVMRRTRNGIETNSLHIIANLLKPELPVV